MSIQKFINGECGQEYRLAMAAAISYYPAAPTAANHVMCTPQDYLEGFDLNDTAAGAPRFNLRRILPQKPTQFSTSAEVKAVKERDIKAYQRLLEDSSKQERTRADLERVLAKNCWAMDPDQTLSDMDSCKAWLDLEQQLVPPLKASKLTA